MTDARSPLRALRAALFAAICVVLAAVGHSSLSAHHVPASSLLLAFGATGTLGWLAGGRRRGTAFIGTGVLAVQGVLHLTFSGAAPQHHAHEAAGPMGASAGMLAVHALAAGACALWLSRGEAAFFRLARTAFVPLRPPLTAVALPHAPSPPRARPRTADRRRPGVVLAHSLSRRGPPFLSAPRATAPGTHV
ncbi:hypothetical protein [Streptomyces sp. NPDC047928]|uniref:hypothetical protein n=1 Tax=unclassified Streptomyces TaxID=2593676 RepID=UPI0037204B76